MRRIQTPRFLSDLYRDLRDRRLLLPIGALLVALVAVPVLLSSGGEDVAPPAAAAPVEDATQVQSAVLAEQGGIRNYRKRLDALKKKNPFKQQFAVPTAASVGIEEAGEASTGTGSAGSSPVLTPGDAASLESSASSAGGGDVSIGDDGEPPVTEPSRPATITKPKPELMFFTGRVDVTVGPLGKAKKIRGVKRLEMLPDKQAPVVAFLGLSEDAERAVFVVSRDVTTTDGDGRCAGKVGGTCQFVELAPDEQRFFHLADGSVHRLRVLGTDVVRVPDPRK
ncbi:MAG: hypothetical protein ACRDK9_03985 [Solirubrobacterales bacterium]